MEKGMKKINFLLTINSFLVLLFVGLIVNCASMQRSLNERVTLVSKMTNLSGEIARTVFINNRKIFATYSEGDNKIILWNAENGTIVRTINPGTKFFDISPDGKILAVVWAALDGYGRTETQAWGATFVSESEAINSRLAIAFFDLESGGKLNELSLGSLGGIFSDIGSNAQHMYKYMDIPRFINNKEILVRNGDQGAIVSISDSKGYWDKKAGYYKFLYFSKEQDRFPSTRVHIRNSDVTAVVSDFRDSSFGGLQFFTPYKGLGYERTEIIRVRMREGIIDCDQVRKGHICVIASGKDNLERRNNYVPQVVDENTALQVYSVDIETGKAEVLAPITGNDVLLTVDNNKKIYTYNFLKNSIQITSQLSKESATFFKFSKNVRPLGCNAVLMYCVFEPFDGSGIRTFNLSEKKETAMSIKAAIKTDVHIRGNILIVKQGVRQTNINLASLETSITIPETRSKAAFGEVSFQFHDIYHELDKYPTQKDSGDWCKIIISEARTGKELAVHFDKTCKVDALTPPKKAFRKSGSTHYLVVNQGVGVYGKNFSTGQRTFWASITGICENCIFQSDSDAFLFIGDDFNNIHIIDWKTQKFLRTLKGLTSRPVSVNSNIEGSLVIAAGEDGVVSIWDIQGNHIAYLILTEKTNQVIFLDKESYYMYPFGKITEEPPFYFSLGLNNYSFDQFDLHFNRPDKIFGNLAKLGMGKFQEKANFWKQAIEQRQKKNGVDTTRESNRVTSDQIVIKMTVEDKGESSGNSRIRVKMNSDSSIIGYKIFTNGVPQYGEYVQRFSPDGKEINSREVTISETIQLSQGENKIEVSAFTEDGVESPRESFTVRYNPPTPYKPELYFVGIGIDNYNASVNGGLDALKYAVKDSMELEDTFKKSGKNFAKVHTKVLANAEVTRDSIGKLKEFLSKSRVDDHVILFLSGHGIRKDTKVGDLITAFGTNVPPQYKLRNKSDVDDVYYYMTSDSHVDKPWEKGVPLDAIREIVNGIPSRQKIMLVDTCQSGEKLDLDDATVASLTKNVEIRKTRGKTAQTRGVKLVTTPGAQQKPEEVEKKIVQTIAKTNALKEMSELFPELRRGTGTIEISAATGAQSALESSEWKNGAFTFVIKEAILKGKAKDAKGNITARSLRKYVLEEVERLTDGQQTPMVARDIAGRDFVIFSK